MIQEENKYLRDKMQDAGLDDLFPEFDKEAEWMQLSGKLKVNSTNIPLYSWLKIAAVLLIVVAVGSYFWFASSVNKYVSNTEIVAQPTLLHQFKDISVRIDSSNREIDAEDKKTARTFADNKPRKPVPMNTVAFAGSAAKTTEPICNATKCSIEICIYQTIHCGNGTPSEIADCRTIEPDQSGQLNYKAPGNMSKDCRVTIDEIRIKKVSTGETIVINANTEPASAQEMFQCFTGETKCDLLAGMFNTGCNDDKPRQLKVGSNFGDVIIQ